MPSNLTPADAIQRRSWPISEKRRLVELTFRSGTSIQEIAKKYDLDSPTLSSWRTLYRKGLLEVASQDEKKKNSPSNLIPILIDPALGVERSSSATVTLQISSEIIVRIEAQTLDYSALGALLAWVRQ